MRDMADLDAVHLGLDENEADIAEELQDFDSFDTRSEASKSRAGSMASDSEPSISSVSTAPSSVDGSRSSKRTSKSKSNNKTSKETAAKSISATASAASTSKSSKSSRKTKRSASPGDLNGKKKKSSSSGSESKSKKPIDTDDKVNSKAQDSEERESSLKKTRSKKNVSGSSSTAAHLSGSGAGNKSDLSDAEDEKPPLPALESDSESSDSDSGIQHKRNGGARSKAAMANSSKGSTPEKDAGGSSNTQKSYDYMTKLNYLFRDTRFFLIKSNNSDNVQLSKNKSVWATLPQNDANLSQAFKEARNVLLIFSVNESGKFAGFARMAAPSRRDIPQVAWVLPPSISPKALGGVIELDWICRKELSFNATLHLHNTWNEGKPVKIGRDGQEIEPKIGAELCRLFPEDEQIELTPILRKSKETARVMREKGIHVIYKAPRSLSTRGHSGGRGNSQLGPMRHKRSYGGHGQPHHHQRPYRHHHHHHAMGMGMPGSGGGGFKRGGSPYRQMGGGAAGAGEMGMPSWERYMSSAAAAEAYVADYIRNMHGQLPPLPFVPPFGQLPMPSAAGAGNALPPGAPASMYEQLPPPVRYYDGPGAPPLPDYPPPQPMRPPPPGFDKAPSYEDFAAWKNAGLPTVSAPPGFPVYAANGGGSSNAGGGVGGANVPSISAGNRDNNNSSVGGRRRDYGGNRSGSSRQFRGERGGGGGGGQRSYRDGRR
ncbi:YTH domain-containing protein 1 [Drosophila hydei]|uniref:YTH domain-containing protein 1 n=1 Tax=Drosophila hydei TaxID=7224 RepID=A0A6J1M2N3_DROHY|nr:YTH domain-containing protein 1 [Drosophila hydei]